ncbi:hypothetical protein [Haloprofundus halobius]|uniref:hypothetical protein n=1 Tax=Haloprofundus halobius TaxID=2876194 RepID=UPI001CCBAA29|nr:hypothetical protein [Haloprofundus halobius]
MALAYDDELASFEGDIPADYDLPAVVLRFLSENGRKERNDTDLCDGTNRFANALDTGDEPPTVQTTKNRCVDSSAVV